MLGLRWIAVFGLATMLLLGGAAGIARSHDAHAPAPNARRLEASAPPGLTARDCDTADPWCLALVQAVVRRTLVADGLESQWPFVKGLLWCESRWRPDAEGRLGELGLWQIHPINAGLWQGRDWRDPIENTEVAIELYHQAGGWWPWSCSRLAPGRTIPLAN